MSLALTTTFLAFFVLVVFIAGTVNGLAGFGFAVVGTMALATTVEPATAVVLMIIPILSANITLLNELSRSELSACWRRFSWLVVSALIGTIIGMAILDQLPEAPLRVGLGLVTMVFVASRQQAVAMPTLSFGTSDTKDRPATMVAVGSVSGLLFGATNVGVQIVAFIRSFDLSHGTFVGVVAMVFVGINTIRVGAAGVLGLYPTTTVFLLSVAAAVPAVVGVAAGKQLRDQLRDHHRRQLVLGLLTIIGIRLILGGLGIA